MDKNKPKTEEELKDEQISKYEALHNYILTFGEAAELYNLGESTLRTHIHRSKLEEGTEVRKSGKTWLITWDALLRFYGDPDEYKNE